MAFGLLLLLAAAGVVLLAAAVSLILWLTGWGRRRGPQDEVDSPRRGE
jgi:hypothetical protein